MLIEIVREDAEQMLLDYLQQSQGKHWGAIHFASASLPDQPEEGQLGLALRPVIGDSNARLYYLAGGDIMVTFHGQQKNIKERVSDILYQQFKTDPKRKLDRYFDAQAQDEELRNFCKERLADMPEHSPDANMSASGEPVLVMTKALQDQFADAKYSRSYRAQPEILIVEDQPFTQSLLQNVLGRQFKTHIAGNALNAWDSYFKYGPDIVFLDIEMPGVNGHELAEALQKVDPDVYIVMVTANNYSDDVARAQKYGAKGYIVKPFNKKKIFDAIEKFTQMKKAG